MLEKAGVDNQLNVFSKVFQQSVALTGALSTAVQPSPTSRWPKRTFKDSQANRREAAAAVLHKCIHSLSCVAAHPHSRIASLSLSYNAPAACLGEGATVALSTVVVQPLPTSHLVHWSNKICRVSQPNGINAAAAVLRSHSLLAAHTHTPTVTSVG